MSPASAWLLLLALEAWLLRAGLGQELADSAASSEASLLVPEFDEVRSPVPRASELFYDFILLKFDPACIAHGDDSLEQHFALSLRHARLTDSESDRLTHGFLSFGSATSSSSADQDVTILELPDEREFVALLDSGGMDAARIVTGAHQLVEPQLIVDAVDRRRRRLVEIPRSDRENDIMAAFHLLAATHAFGSAEKVSNFISFEKKGDIEGALDYIRNTSRLTSITDEQISRARDRGRQRRIRLQKSLISLTRDMRKAAGDGAKLLQGEWLGSKAVPLLTDTESLGALDLRIIDNPLMGAELLRLAQLLPCLEFQAEPDRSKEPLGAIDYGSVRQRRLQAASRNSNLTLTVDPDASYMDAVPFGEDADDRYSSFLGWFKGSPKTVPSTRYSMQAPNDAHFDSQWYLRGESQHESFGGYVIDGWSHILRDQQSKTSSLDDKITLEFADLGTADYGMVVAILDSGCSRNPDLVNQFWHNTAELGCTDDSFVGNTAISLDSNTLKGDCVGYDFGNDRPDPTHEAEGRIHGSSTSGLVAAEANNGIGIAGVCPNCKIMCLKIYDSDKQKITMTSVIRALNYIAEKKVNVSNHSYGGFGASNIEYSAHRSLDRLGHLSVCSSGNNGCNIDNDPGDDQSCVSDSGEPLGPFTPASYDLANILSVGGTDQDGKRAWFSNYGSTSVDLFAPGTDIITVYGASQLASVKGTSFSSPIVAGMAAVLWSYKPHLTAYEVKELLMHTGVPVPSLRGKSVEGRIASLARALSATNSYSGISHVASNSAHSSLPVSMTPMAIAVAMILQVHNLIWAS